MQIVMTTTEMSGPVRTTARYFLTEGTGEPCETGIGIKLTQGDEGMGDLDKLSAGFLSQ